MAAMTRCSYRIRAGTVLSPEPDGRYRIDSPQGEHTARLHPPAVAPLLLLDGRRSEEEIERTMAETGTPIPQGVTGNVIRSLVAAKILEPVETDWLPLEHVSWPEHRCDGCGASCQGHWIGPLEHGFVTETTTRMPNLRDKYPQLVDKRPFVRIVPGDSALFLNSETGQCLFLGEDLRCILHKEYGPEAKPTICRMFPHVRFEDGERTRLGVGLMCMKHFDQVLDAEQPAAEKHWEELNESISGWLYHYYPPTNQAELEEDVIASLPNVEDPLAELLDAVTPSRKRMAGRVNAPRRLDMLAKKHLARVEEVLAAEPLMQGLAQQTGVFPEAVAEIRAFAKQARKNRPTVLPRPLTMKTPALKTLLEDALRRFLVYRQHLMFVGLQHGTAAFCLGILTSLILAQEVEERERRAGQLIAAWMRTIQSPGVRAALFQGPDEVVLFLRTFYQYWCS